MTSVEGYQNEQQRQLELNKPRLIVRLIEARALKAADFNGFSDPFVEIRIKGQVTNHKTRIIKKSLNPMWNEEFVLYPTHPETDILLLKIYDYDANSCNDLIGEMEYPVPVFMNKPPTEEWKQVMNKKGPAVFVPGTGELKMSVTYLAQAISNPSPMIPPVMIPPVMIPQYGYPLYGYPQYPYYPPPQVQGQPQTYPYPTQPYPYGYPQSPPSGSPTLPTQSTTLPTQSTTPKPPSIH